MILYDATYIIRAGAYRGRHRVKSFQTLVRGLPPPSHFVKVSLDVEFIPETHAEDTREHSRYVKR